MRSGPWTSPGDMRSGPWVPRGDVRSGLWSRAEAGVPVRGPPRGEPYSLSPPNGQPSSTGSSYRSFCVTIGLLRSSDAGTARSSSGKRS